MKYYKFKYFDSVVEGVVLNFLNPILGVSNEIIDMEVKYICPISKKYVTRFNNFEDVELKEITKKEFLNYFKK